MPRPCAALTAAALALLIVAGCTRESNRAPAGRGEPPVRPRPTRGYVLISIDTLRADRIGAWGYDRPTTPFLDRLAARGALFERAWSPIPATLPAHLSIFTGLYPGQHDVDPPSGVLSPEIPTLPELFRAAGYRTAGHVEGGFMAGGYGFSRGFEEWSDDDWAADTDVDRTFGRGVDFLRRLGPEERFFLFLHTYAVHDPYEPAAEYLAPLRDAPPPAGAPPPTGTTLAAFNRGELDVDAATAAWYSDLYDASIRQVDAALERLWTAIEDLDLADEVTLIVTSDHGEEFLEHGHLAHVQLYPESLHVPLLVVTPDLETPRRIPALVQLVDLLPTLVDLAALDLPDPVAGVNLTPWLTRPDLPLERVGWAENDVPGGRERSVLARRDGATWQLLHAALDSDADGTWVSRRVQFSAPGGRLDFDALAFGSPRTIEVRVDDVLHDRLDLGTDWSARSLQIPGKGRRRIELATPDCAIASTVGPWNDDRCLSFKVRGLPLDRIELYDLDSDPLAQRDLVSTESRRMRGLISELEAVVHRPVAKAGQAALTDAQVRQLRALGYL